mmetsp:Transcript_13847/g.22876  ORF Transcript_13847/g.22876 Transcript_13847/m.22876 type:complete len:286 (+) Transcript_13847:567-1424(+)
MMYKSNEQLYGKSTGDERQTRSRHCTLLVQCAVFHAIYRSHYVLAEVATKVRTWLVWVRALALWQAHPMAHHHKGFEAQGNGNGELVVCSTQHCWQPSALTRVGQQEHHVMLYNQLLQLPYTLFHCTALCRTNWVARHGNRQVIRRAFHKWENALKVFSSSGSLWFPTFQTVVKVEERLTHWVGEGHSAAIHKRDVSDTPAQEGTCNCTAEGARTKQQALGCGNVLRVEGGCNAPSHQLNIQVDGLVCQLPWIQCCPQVHHTRRRTASCISLPSQSLDFELLSGR